MKLVPFIVFAVLFVSVFVYVYLRGNKTKNNKTAANTENYKKRHIPDNPYNGLRKQALEITAEQLGLHLPDNQPAVYGIIMDIGMDEGVATIVAYTTGDASLYLSSGGGLIGGGQKSAAVNSAANQFVTTAQKLLNMATKAESTTVAAKDTVKFYLLTNRGVYLLTEGIKRLENGSSPYNSLFADGNLLVTQLRAHGNL